jgi:hypothetical protein
VRERLESSLLLPTHHVLGRRLESSPPLPTHHVLGRRRPEHGDDELELVYVVVAGEERLRAEELWNGQVRIRGVIVQCETIC